MCKLPHLLALMAVVGLSGCNTPSASAPPLDLQAVEYKVPPKPAGVYDPSEVTTQPIPVRQRRPIYPFELRRRGISGEAVVLFTVRSDGSVGDVSLVKATDIRFGQAAADCVAQWQFRPAAVQGRTVDCWMMVPIVFTLD